MQQNFKAVFSAISIALWSNAAFAQETDPTVAGDWGYSVQLSTMSIDNDTAVGEGIDKSALTLGVYADYTKNDWVTSLGMDVVFYDDNNEFSQTVIGDGIFNDGDISTESSDAVGYLATVATGYQWYFGEENSGAFQLQGGFAGMLSSERSIANCSDCRGEDIDVNGGAFVNAKLLGSGSVISYGLTLRQYVSGDLGTVIGFQIGSAF